MTEPIAYLKGEFIPEREAKLPVYDAGIVLGATVTEMIRLGVSRFGVGLATGRKLLEECSGMGESDR